jgi:hypothetical protein
MSKVRPILLSVVVAASIALLSCKTPEPEQLVVSFKVDGNLITYYAGALGADGGGGKPCLMDPGEGGQGWTIFGCQHAVSWYQKTKPDSIILYTGDRCSGYQDNDGNYYSEDDTHIIAIDFHMDLGDGGGWEGARAYGTFGGTLYGGALGSSIAVTEGHFLVEYW